MDLIQEARGGDRDATERLLRLIAPDLYRIAYSMLRDHDQTDEVVQEVMIRLFRYLVNLKDPAKFPSWVMRVTVNQVQSWRMKRGRDRLVEFHDSMETAPGAVVIGIHPASPRQNAIGGEVRREIEEAVSELPNRQQMALVLFEIEGCSIKEVASAMSCSEGAVKFNIHEARKKLQRKLRHLFVSNSRPPQSLTAAGGDHGGPAGS